MGNFHLDGSLISWLIYADYLDDNDQNGSIIREMVDNPITNQWYWENNYRINNVGGNRSFRVGTIDVGIDRDYHIGGVFYTGVAFNYGVVGSEGVSVGSIGGLW